MKPFLSLCMIVKNEEKVLRRCLESVIGIVDEIIIIDTGSTDGTKEIANEFTSLVFDYKWEDDFSKGRNHAASKATGEWILVLDADEFVERESFKNFKNELKENLIDKNILAVKILNFLGIDGKETLLNYHERIYMNNGKIKYHRTIHEMLKHNDSLEKVGIANLQVYHSGYMTAEKREKNKSQRNLKLLNKKTHKEAIDYYFLGNEYSALGELSKAIDFYKKGYQLKNSITYEWVPKLLVRLIFCLHAEKRYTEALDIIIPSEEVFIELVDFKYLKGKIYQSQRKNKEAIKVFETILSQKDKLKTDSSIDYLEYLPHKHLGELYEKEKLYQDAVHHYSKTLSVNDSDDYTWTRLINLLAKHSSKEQLVEFLYKNILIKNKMSHTRLIKVLLNVPNNEVLKLINLFYKELDIPVIEKESLKLKMHLIGGQYSEIIEIINLKSVSELSRILHTDIFSIIDFIILTIEQNEEKYRTLLLNLNTDKSIKKLINTLFFNKSKKLSLIEESLFIGIYKRAIVVEAEKSTVLMKLKKEILSLDGKKELKRELREYDLGL